MDPHKLLLAVPYDEVSKVAGNPLVFNNVEEIYRWLDILANNDPKVKDVRVDIVAFFNRYDDAPFMYFTPDVISSIRISDDRTISIPKIKKELYGC